MIEFIEPIEISDPTLITAVQLLQTGNYFVVSWHDFKVVIFAVAMICIIIGYALAKIDIKKKEEVLSV